MKHDIKIEWNISKKWKSYDKVPGVPVHYLYK